VQKFYGVSDNQGHDSAIPLSKGSIEKKKIGILTWYFGTNYGAKAQAFALQSVLNKLEFSTKVIRFLPEDYQKINILASVTSKKNLLNIKNTTALIRRNNKFRNFDKRFSLTAQTKSDSDIDNLHLDTVVLGSDAIFNVKHPLFNPIYYGVGLHTPKISYAASCEYLEPDYQLSDDIKSSIREMRAVSVRDVNTQELIRNNTGITPVITLDPTFLYNFHEFNKPVSNKPYILVYTFSEWNQISSKVKRYARSHDLEIISVGCKCSWSDKSYESADEETWISSFRDAELVITDSFHGTVFSIKNKKQILLLGRPDKSAKINSLLQGFGISREYYQTGEDVEKYLEDTIDYDVVGKIVDQKVAESIKFLKDNIG